MLEHLYRTCERTSFQAVVAGNCTSMYSSGKREERGVCDMVEGFGAVMFPSHVFKDDFFSDYLPRALQHTACFTGDDYVISNYLWMHKIPRLQVDTNVHLIYQNPLGYNADALHRQDEGNSKRYHACYRKLKSMHLAHFPIQPA